jgi:RNA polymerase sigma-70 factor (ECF subfamily)
LPLNAGLQHIDSQLAEQLKNGSENAFRTIFNHYAGRIYTFGKSHLKDGIEAEELVQIVFLRLWNSRQNIDSSQNIKAFLFKIAVNAIYDIIRKKNVQQKFQQYIQTQFNPEIDSTWDEVVFHDMQAQINLLVDQMPTQRKLIFKLSKEQGLSNDEIAEKLNLSKRTVENHLFRAVGFLKKNLDHSNLAVALFFVVYMI